MRMRREQRDLLVDALAPRAQGSSVRVLERNSVDRLRLVDRADLTSRIAFFDSLDEAAGNPCAIRELLRRHPTLLAGELDLPAEQGNGLPADTGERAHLGFWHYLIHIQTIYSIYG